MDARSALADALSAELDEDITLEFMWFVDRLLARLYMHGYIVCDAPSEPEAAEVG